MPYCLSSEILVLIPIKGLFQYPSFEGGCGRRVAKTADFFDARLLAKIFGL